MTKTNETMDLAQNNGQALQPITDFKSMEQFQMILNEPPSKKDLKKNKFVKLYDENGNVRKDKNGNIIYADYLPISKVEMYLHQFFPLMWKTQNLKLMVIGNEIVVDLELHIYNPFIKEWIPRVGGAAVPIQQKAGSSITDLDGKIKNALVKNYPSVISEALKNAAKKFGVKFGGGLNRDDEMVHNPFSEVLNAKDLIKSATSTDDLLDLFNSNPEWENHDDIMELLTKRKMELKKLSA